MGIELAIGALAAGIGAGTTFTLAAGLTPGFSWVAAAVSFGLGILQTVMAKKPNNFDGTADIKNQGQTQNIRQAITTRRTIFGECRVGGAITFIETTASDLYLHLVLTIADHESAEFGEVWFDDTSIPPDYIDGSGNVIAGPFAGKARLKFHLGTSGQTADSDLVAETSVDSNFKGRGVTYLYARLEFDRTVYVGRIPTITVFLKGKKPYDSRTGLDSYSPNTILFVNDFITEPVDSFTPGVGVAQTSVDDTAFIAASNIADEYVPVTAIDDPIISADPVTDTLTLTGVNGRCLFQTGDKLNLLGASLPGGLTISTDYFAIMYQRKDVVRIRLATSLANALAGTAINITSSGTGTVRKMAEPRYHGGGIIDTVDSPKTNLTKLLTGSGGTATYIGGKWFIKAAAYSTPVFSFNESHIISSIVVRTKVARRDRFNLVKGVYISPLNDGETSDYPPYQNSTYIAADNGKTLPIDYDLAITQRPQTGRRLAKIKLERNRQESYFEAEFKLHAMQVQPGDTLYLSVAKLGWSNKIFEVISWTLAVKKIGTVPLFYVKMALQETASECFDWNNGEEIAVDPAPNTNLRNPRFVGVVVGFSIDSLPVTTLDGDTVYNILASWNVSPDPYVADSGVYEVFFKESVDTLYKSAGKVDGTMNNMILNGLKIDVLYDVQIIAYNNLGVPSQPSTINNFLVGSSITTNTEDWENLTEPRNGTDWESGTATSENWN